MGVTEWRQNNDKWKRNEQPAPFSGKKEVDLITQEYILTKASFEKMPVLAQNKEILL